MGSRLFHIKRAVAGVLGHECAGCGRTGHWSWEVNALHLSPQAFARLNPLFLQVGHPDGRHWSIRRVNTVTRWLRYLKEALAGKVQAECGPCNRKHGGGLRYKKVDRTRQGKRRP